MRMSGVGHASWSKAKERLLRHMFILDLIRDFNTFAGNIMANYALSANKDKETLDYLRGIIEKQKKSALYIIFTEDEKSKYKDDLLNTDDAILDRVAKM